MVDGIEAAILVVDDELFMLELYRRLLPRAGYAIVSAGSVSAALEILADRQRPV